jgi:ribosomal protein L29
MPASSKFNDQSIEELKMAHLDLSKSIFRLKNELKTAHKLEKPHRIRQMKQDRARVLTALRAKQKLEEV